MRTLVLRVQLGHRQVLLPVTVEPLRRRGEREMRAHERDEQHPRAVAPLRRLLVQPDLRARRDVAVVHRVRRLAGAGAPGHLVAALALGNVLADQALDVADAVDDVHRHDLFGEAVVVARTAAEMQLADRDDAMPGVAQRVMPARDRAFVTVGVVPVADVVHVAADGERRPRRHADRARRVRRREACSPRGQCVEVRRRDERMAGSPEELRIVLVGHQHEQVGGAHAGKYRTAARPCILGVRVAVPEET